MPRIRREKCKNGIYHIIVRGNNQQDIFFDDADRNQYLKRLQRYKIKFQIEIYAYCLMTNHVHLLVYDNGQDISKFMQGLSLSYVIYFNKKYGRTGHLFQDRFKSILVKNDAYFIYVSKYIHLNPVKAGIISNARKYRWSSYKVYAGYRDYWEIINVTPILMYFSSTCEDAMGLYMQYVYQVEESIDEVAITNEVVNEPIINSQYIGITHQQLLAIIEEHLGVHILHLMRKNNRIYSIQRDICIYMLVLIEQRGYKEIAKMFLIKPAAVGVSIKRTIELMIKNQDVMKEIYVIRDKVGEIIIKSA